VKLKHRWSLEDNLVAFYLYKFGTKNLSYSEDLILDLLGISKGSMKMAKQNFLSLDGKNHGALKNASKMGKEVFEKYNSMDSEEISLEVTSYLEIKKSNHHGS
jgi:hypothetical protein